MSQTTILEEVTEHFDVQTGEIFQNTKHRIKKSKIEPTDEFIKVSKYLNTIFAFNGIPLNLVPISLLFAQYMEFKTNKIYLLKPTKEEFAQMLDISLDRVNKLIKECQSYDIIRPVSRGIYEVNSFLYSTGNIAETRDLQAHFDFDKNAFITTATQKNKITGVIVRKAVATKKNSTYPGQMTLGDFGYDLASNGDK